MRPALRSMLATPPICRKRNREQPYLTMKIGRKIFKKYLDKNLVNIRPITETRFKVAIGQLLNRIFFHCTLQEGKTKPSGHSFNPNSSARSLIKFTASTRTLSFVLRLKPFKICLLYFSLRRSLATLLVCSGQLNRTWSLTSTAPQAH